MHACRVLTGPLADGFAHLVTIWMWVRTQFGSLPKPCPYHYNPGFPLISKAVYRAGVSYLPIVLYESRFLVRPCMHVCMFIREMWFADCSCTVQFMNNESWVIITTIFGGYRWYKGLHCACHEPGLKCLFKQWTDMQTVWTIVAFPRDANLCMTTSSVWLCSPFDLGLQSMYMNV